MTPIKQRHKHWCALACIESACKDFNNPWTQEMLYAHFKGFFPPPEHHFSPILIPSICFSIALSTCFRIGTGKEFIREYSDHLNKLSVFIATQKDKTGGKWGHCLRLKSADDKEFIAMNPAQGEKDFVDYPWDYLTDHDCLIYVAAQGSVDC